MAARLHLTLVCFIVFIACVQCKRNQAKSDALKEYCNEKFQPEYWKFPMEYCYIRCYCWDYDWRLKKCDQGYCPHLPYPQAYPHIFYPERMKGSATALTSTLFLSLWSSGWFWFQLIERL